MEPRAEQSSARGSQPKDEPPTLEPLGFLHLLGQKFGIKCSPPYRNLAGSNKKGSAEEAPSARSRNIVIRKELTCFQTPCTLCSCAVLNSRQNLIPLGKNPEQNSLPSPRAQPGCNWAVTNISRAGKGGAWNSDVPSVWADSLAGRVTAG